MAADPLDGIPAHLRGQVHADEYGYWTGRLTVREREQFVAGLQAKYDAAQALTRPSSESDTVRQLEALHKVLDAVPPEPPKPTIGDILNLKPKPRDPEVSDRQPPTENPPKVSEMDVPSPEKWLPRNITSLPELNAGVESPKSVKFPLAEQIERDRARLKAGKSKPRLPDPEVQKHAEAQERTNEALRKVTEKQIERDKQSRTLEARHPEALYIAEEETLGKRIGDALKENLAEAERLLQLSKRKRDAESAPPGLSPLDKFWKLTESNFFMGGGVGIAVGAYAFILASAPRFGFFLLIAAWAVMSVSVWKHHFFENRSTSSQFIGNLIICGLIGIALFAVWILLIG